MTSRISADILYSDISDGFIFDGSSLFVGGIAGNFIGIGGGWVMGIILAIVGSCAVIFVAKKLGL